MTRPRRPVRIAHVIDGLGQGGAEQVLLANLAALAPHEFENTVYYLYPYDRLRPRVEALGIRAIGLNLRRLSELPWCTLRLARVLRANQPDIVHTHLFAADVSGRIAARLAGVTSIVSTFHAPMFESGSSIRFSRWRYLLQRITYRATGARGVAVSEYVRASVERYLGDPGAVVIRNPVDFERWQPVFPAEREQQRRKLGFGTSDFVVACVGRLHPEKGQHVLLRAAAIRREAGSQLKILLIGEGPERGRLTAMAGELSIAGDVHFFGAVDNPRDILAACDAVAVPSLFEGFGLVLAEGMAAGLTSVASSVGAIPEIASDQETALLVPPDDPHALARALERLEADIPLRVRLAQAATERTRKTIGRERSAARLRALYLDLARAGASERRDPLKAS